MIKKIIKEKKDKKNSSVLPKRIKPRKKKERLEDLLLPSSQIDYIAKTLVKKIDKEIFEKKYARVKDVLYLVGAGAFLALSMAIPTLPQILLPFIKKDEYEAFRRFNLPYLKRTLKRLEEQKLVEIEDQEGFQIIKITNVGRRKILKYALDELVIKKPRIWDGKWRLISYDIPKKLNWRRQIFRDYLRAWRFYPLHESVYFHAYPCEKEVEFLREYLQIGKYVRIFTVFKIENDAVFRDFFGV
ncbi:hypothetical protein ISS85_00270 [Candidatus Microgenomates bacterium]|nr:hypothetical protein [Candidatus Microgenomates bacterium]